MDKRPLAVDYERLDVSKIMDQIKRSVAAEAGPEKTPGAGAGAPPAPESPPGPAAPISRSRTRRLLLRFMSPLRPLIKLLILPVYEEHRQTVEILDQTNRRLDRLYKIVEEEHGAVLNELREYTKLLHHLSHNLVVEMTKLKLEVEALRTRILVLEKDFESLGRRERALEQELSK